MRKLLLLLALAIPASAQTSFFGFNGQCSKGGQAVLVQNQPSKGTVPIGGTTRTLTSGVLASYPSCTVDIYLTGTTTRATIFSDSLGTVTTNPFTANTDGSFLFFAAAGQYDVVMSGAGMPAVVILTDIQLGATGGGGGGGGGSVQPGPQNAVPRYSASGTSNVLSPGSCSDDLLNPFLCPLGFDVGTTGGYDYQVANNTSTGTTDLTLACNDGAENAITCPAATAPTNVPIGFVVAGSGGVAGNAKLCNLGWCTALVDNTATAGHFAIESSTVDGQLHDIGTSQIGGQANFFIFSSNGGAGTPSQIRLLIASDFQSAGGGFPNPMTTLGDIIQGGAAGVPARLAGPTTPNDVPQVLSSQPTGGLATPPFWTPQGIVPNAQTGTTYTVAATDRLGYVTFSNGSPIAVTLPQAGTAGFDLNFAFEACSIGAGTTTITPTTSTISYTTGTTYVPAASSIALSIGHCAIIKSDNTNYFATSNTASSGGSVSSVGLTVNSTSPSGIFTVTGSPVTTSGSLNFNLAGNSGGIPYFSSGTVLSSSSLLTAHGVVTGGGAATSPGSTSAGAADTIFMGNDSGTGSDPAFKAGPSGGTNGCAGTTDTPTYNTTTHAWGCHQITPGTGTTTSVGLTVNSTSPSGIFTVTGSPVTTSGTLNFNLAGTSGGHPYFSSSTVLSSTTAQTTHGIWLAQGAGNADTTTGVGTTTTVLHGNASGDPTYGAVVGADMTNGTVTATQLDTPHKTGQCEVVWGGSGAAFALTSGDDSIANQSCYNKIGSTKTITAVYCRSDAGSNTTTVNPTFGTSGTGTTILSGALTCGSSGAYSSTGTVSSGALTDGSNINPVMGGTLTGTSIHVLFVYTY